MGVTPDQLVSLKTTTIVIPGDDNTPSSESGRTAHRMTPGCEMHDLGLDDVDIALIPYLDWAHACARNRQCVHQVFGTKLIVLQQAFTPETI